MIKITKLINSTSKMKHSYSPLIGRGCRRREMSGGVWRGLIFLLLLTGCAKNSKQEFVRTIKTTNPVPVENTTIRTLPGIVKENQIVNIGFKVAGQIEKIYVKEGDFVNEGQVLGKLDDKDYKLQLSAVEIQYNQMKTEVERMEELHKRNSISGNDYEKAIMGLNATKIQLEGYQNQVDYTILKAPASGYIQSINFKKSEMVDAGRPVFSLMDMSSVIVETYLPANLYIQKDYFGEISCRANLLPGKEFPIKILSISHKSNGNQLYKTQLRPVNSNENQLSAGMNIEVSITLHSERNGSEDCVLPVNCVFTENGKHYVWIFSQEQSVVQKKEVKLNSIDGNGNIILSGVKPNDVIVSAGVQYLQEGEKVSLITESKTNVGGRL